MAAAAATNDDVPLLVRVLAGNPVTGACILSCLTAADTRALRRLHAAVAAVAAGVPWAADKATPVVDAVRWRAALPSAMGARLAEGHPCSIAAMAALAGVTYLDSQNCSNVTDEVLRRLPTSLSTLNVSMCTALTARASFAHLTALVSLDSEPDIIADLPATLQELNVSSFLSSSLPADLSLAHLSQLRVLRASRCSLIAVTLASLPPSLVELDVESCRHLTAATSFTHLHALQKLNIAWSTLCDAALARLPPSLVHLNVVECTNLTPAATLPPLPALRLLDISRTAIGDALVASLPAALEELRMVSCRSVTAGATLDHVHALRALYSMGTPLAPAVLAACRARGCAVPAARELRGHQQMMTALAVLADGRLASGDFGGQVRLWDAVGGGDATAVFPAERGVRALAALPDGRRLAVGTRSGVEVWKVTAGTPPVRSVTIHCAVWVYALAVLADGCLAVGCDDGGVQVVDVDTGAVLAVMEGHGSQVAALAALPDGTLASGSWDGTVQLWDVGTQKCVAKQLDGQAGMVWSLAVLADGRLACGTSDSVIALLNVGSRTWVGSLAAYSRTGTALAALPDGRLVSESDGGVIQLWDTRPAAAAAMAASSRAANTVAMTVIANVLGSNPALVLLPDGRLACACGCDVILLDMPPPAAFE